MTEPVAEPVSVVNADGSFAENWNDKFGEENKAHLSRYKTFDDLVNSHIATKKKFGKNPDTLIEIPSETSSDEVKAAFRKAKGMPDNTDSYEYTLPDEMAVKLGSVDDKKMTAFREFAHKQEWSPKQFKDALDFYHTNVAADVDTSEIAFNEQRAVSIEANKAELKKEWLGDYQTNVDEAQSIMVRYGGVDAVAELDLQNSPTLIKFLNNISKHMNPDAIKGQDAASVTTAANIKTQLADIYEEIAKVVKENPANFKGNAKYKELVERKHELNKQRHSIK